MELFIAIQGPEHVFVGDLPTTISEAHKKLALACGVSVKSFAKNRRSEHKCSRADIQKRRGVRVTAIAANLLQRLGGAWTRKVNECAHELQGLLTSRKYAESIHRLMWQDLQAGGRSVTQLLNEESLGPNVLRSAAYSTFRGLNLAFTVEAPAFVFDYFSLHRRCWELVRQIRSGVVASQENKIIKSCIDGNANPDVAQDLARDLIG